MAVEWHAHAYSLATQEAEAGRIEVRSQSG
jgi:hypothetical protein